MSNSLSKKIYEIRELFDDLCDKIEDESENFSEDVQELWGESKQHLKKLKGRLEDAVQDLKSSSQEASLQAHLATMDAHDQWQDMKGNLSAFASQVKNKTQPPIDQALLKAHLAKMEARDFINGPGKEIAKDFEKSVEKAEEVSLKAAADIKEYCEGVIAGLPK